MKTGTLIWLGVGALLLIGGAVTAIVLIKRHNKLKGSVRNLDDSRSTLNTLSNHGIKPTYGPAQYSTWANNLQQALDGCGDGWQNQKGVWAGLKNDADAHSIVDAYGIRTVDKCGLGTGDFKGDLPSTLVYKYSGLESATSGGSISAINAILKKNGLTFQF